MDISKDIDIITKLLRIKKRDNVKQLLRVQKIVIENKYGKKKGFILLHEKKYLPKV
jgi:hypothetical protein